MSTHADHAEFFIVAVEPGSNGKHKYPYEDGYLHDHFPGDVFSEMPQHKKGYRNRQVLNGRFGKSGEPYEKCCPNNIPIRVIFKVIKKEEQENKK